MATWRELITEAMTEVGEDWRFVVGFFPAEPGWLDEPFDNGYGGTNGTPFTLWTTTRVYFPAMYDGAEWAASMPRHPCEVASEHVGG